jgi:hypothetical protein
MMFWRIIRWGGTAVIVLLAVLAAVAGGGDSGDNAEPNAKPVAAKNFNL